MGNIEKCEFKILCLEEEFKCDGIACLQDRIFKEGLPQVASTIFNIDISITRTSAKTRGNCKPPKDSK